MKTGGKKLKKMIEDGIVPAQEGVWIDTYNKKCSTIAGSITTGIDFRNLHFVTEGRKEQIPLNTKDGCAQTIKSQYGKNSISNFFHSGGYGATGILETDKVIVVGRLPDCSRYDKSRVLSPDGISKCITSEAGKGFPPRIMTEDKRGKGERILFGLSRTREHSGNGEIKNLNLREAVNTIHTQTGSARPNMEVYVAEAGTDEAPIGDILEALKERRIRIRKLTPRERFRLMGVKEADIDRIQKTKFRRRELIPVDNQDTQKTVSISKSQQYKMAGNSIVVDCLFYIFRNLFIGVPEDEKDTLF